jgi:hypothetical protein
MVNMRTDYWSRFKAYLGSLFVFIVGANANMRPPIDPASGNRSQQVTINLPSRRFNKEPENDDEFDAEKSLSEKNSDVQIIDGLHVGINQKGPEADLFAEPFITNVSSISNTVKISESNNGTVELVFVSSNSSDQITLNVPTAELRQIIDAIEGLSSMK